jgi:hypothetical protein
VGRAATVGPQNFLFQVMCNAVFSMLVVLVNYQVGNSNSDCHLKIAAILQTSNGLLAVI